ncbi:mediator of RNA polymerase II transcription subunit 14 [Aspergillus cavernicola]|uniref:Mediator of RNA polymerase II transcription subunit 14 n=1 Tax=Aspergillus cavernicola TaxID=176166 RepID=A0ABR4IZN1_9EURO
MPGVVMDQKSVGGQGLGFHDQMNGISSTPMNNASQSGNTVESQNGSLRANGTRHVEPRQNDETTRAKVVSSTSREPPELQHITQGFFPFSKLINRSAQQCWNDLSELIAELAEIQISSQDSNTPGPVNGKLPGNQSSENVRKKLRALEFAQTKRAEFIKLLVLSQWSRQAADVSKLINIQNFIRIQHQSYMGALQSMGDMKRDLVRAQVANPDLRTALEVLSKGEVVAMPDLGYKAPKPLNPKSTLRKLRKINRIISARLALHENIPFPFQTYRVHDGRVTFVVPGEFELDLSIGEENHVSQFYFVDIRFLFNPSTSIPAGRMFSELDLKANDTLRHSGLPGCFDWLHNLVLTNKINIFTKQATDLARGLWSNVLRIELLHRILVLQYWASKPGAKSWLEIGIRRGNRANKTSGQHSPSLGLRWMRDGQEVNSKDIEFDTENLSVECLLRSVVALHISHILSSAFTKISEKLLYSRGSLSLRAHLTRTEPGECQLDVQLTASRRLRIAIEPMSGAIILAATPNTLERTDIDRNTDRPTIDDIVSRAGRLRCAGAIEEVESKVKMLGFESINPRNVKIDARRLFPASVLRYSFFRHHLWDRNWLLAATSSMDGDNWWVVQIRPAEPTTIYPSFDATTHTESPVCSAQIICSTLLPVQHTGYASLADLGHRLTGALAIYANARFLEDLQIVKFLPPLDQLKVGSGVQAPDLMIRYEASKLPQALRMALPPGFKKKAFITDTVRLAFHGVDRHRNVAMIVAYGNLCEPSQAFSTLIRKEDRSLVFQKAGTGFALRLLAPPGHPILIDLFESLQRLECVLSIYKTLQRKKMDTHSLSLSRIDFAYGPDRDLSAHINIETSQPLLPTEVDPTKLASRTDPLFHLRLGIRFDHSNPHRRIQGSLASNLNRPTTDAGLDNMAELLSFTLPLMRALDRIMANPTHNEPLKMHVTVRNAKSFQIHYPLEGYRFQLVAHQRQSQPVWVLKDDPSLQNGHGENQFKRKLQESLYGSKGAGWKGHGNGVVAEPHLVGNLLEELDKCLASIRVDLASRSLDSKPAHDAPVANNHPPAKEQPKPTKGADLRDVAGHRNVQQKTAAPQKADIIMID